MVVDQDGRTYSGIIAAETATSLTLRRGDGAEDTILRAQVAEIDRYRAVDDARGLREDDREARDGRPDRLPAGVAPRRRGQGPDADERSRPLDIGTLPGLIEPED